VQVKKGEVFELEKEGGLAFVSGRAEQIRNVRFEGNRVQIHLFHNH
jgi:hypothetical protein